MLPLHFVLARRAGALSYLTIVHHLSAELTKDAESPKAQDAGDCFES